MHKGRLEAFCDGVLAIIITIMVLELKVPHGSDFQDLIPLLPVFFSYILSFVYVGIYWNNHHHLFQAAKHVSGRVLWANLHLLFWLSLVPFVTAWAGENHFAQFTVALYGIVLLMAGFSYFLLSIALVSLHGADSALAKALGSDFKSLGSLIAYLSAIPLAFWNANLSMAIYVFVAVVWLVPDSRIAKVLPKE